jgi:2-oxoisovalerate dehydrogenase E1 component alpha subunit
MSIRRAIKFLKKRDFNKLSIRKSTVSVTVEENNVQITANGPIAITNQLSITDTKEFSKWPVFRVLDPSGSITEGGIDDSSITHELAVKMYTTMGRVQSLDDIMYNAQRQGRISFYMQNSGEEATHIGN